MGYKSRFIAKEIDSDLMLYDPDIDEVHILNGTAQAIYKCLIEGKTREEIELELRGHFMLAEGHDLRSEIEECLALLLKKGLVDEKPAE